MSAMMLEVAVESDEEWDSSRSWEDLPAGLPKRRSPKALIPSSPTPSGRSRFRPPDRRSAGACAQRRMARQGQADQRPVFSDGGRTRSDAANVAGQNCCSETSSLRMVSARRSGRQRRPFDQHATHLLVHGTLHLLGYDHHVTMRPRTWRRARCAPSHGSALPIPTRRPPDGDRRRRGRLQVVARHAAPDLRRRCDRRFARRSKRPSTKRRSGAPRRRRPLPDRATDAPQHAPLRRTDRRRHLRDSRRHHGRAVQHQLRRSGARVRRRRTQPPAGLW